MADLELRFGVAGGGTLAGESGREILTDLQTICSNISNSKLLKVRISLDNQTKFGGLTKEIEAAVANAKNIKLKFGIDKKYIEGELKACFANYKPADGGTKKGSTTSNSIASKAISEYQKIANLQRQIHNGGKIPSNINELKAELQVARSTYNMYRSQIEALADAGERLEANRRIEKEIEAINLRKTSLIEKDNHKANPYLGMTGGDLTRALYDGQGVISRISASLQGLQGVTYIDDLQVKVNQISSRIGFLREQSKSVDLFTKEDTLEAQQLLQQLEELDKKVKGMMGAYSNPQGTGYAKLFRNISDYNNKFGDSIKVRDPAKYDRLIELMNAAQSGSFIGGVGALSREFSKLQGEITQAGAAAETLFQKTKRIFKEKFSYGLIGAFAMYARRAMRELITSVVEVDAAMTELRKVTDEVDSTYEKFLDRATSRAKDLGAKVSDVVKATADFARLGYDLDDASTLADASTVYKNVGDGINSIDDASSSIISTMKAFGVEASDAMTIVDRFNEVGNNFAISSKGVGDALLRSASALAAGNNTLDESIALITAANSTVQDADKVGTAIKTVSMYLRAAKTEAEDAGESTDGMADSVSELRSEILALTGDKVDIQLDEDTFKGTYQIMKELSEVWGELSDISQANILEMIGGKRNSNVVMSLLENFEIAEDVIKTSANSAGSALAENEKYLDSINGKLAEFKATFEEFSLNLIDTGFVKDVIGMGSGLLNFLNVFANVLSAVGGLKSVLVMLTGVLLYKNITKISGAFLKFTDIISRVPIVFNSLRSSTALAVPGVTKMEAALKGLGITASATQVKIALLAIAITAAIAIYNAHKQKLEEQRRAAAEAADELKESASSIDEYKKQIEELRKAIDGGNLSEGEAYNKRQELLSIQNSLIDTYGKEAAGIDLVTGSLENQKSALDELSKKKWENYKRSNTSAIDEAVELFTDFSPKKVDPWGAPASGGYDIKVPSSGELWDAIEELGIEDMVPADFHDDLEKRLLDAGIGIEIPLLGVVGDFTSNLNIDSIYEALDVYTKLYDITEDFGKYHFGGKYNDYVGGSLAEYSAIISAIEAKIKESESTFNTYVEGLLLYDTEYSSAWGKVLAAQKQYNDALLSGDDTAIETAVGAMSEVQAVILEAGWTNEAVNLYVEEFFDKWNTETAKYDFEIKIKAKLDSDSLFRSGVEGNLSILAGDDGITDVYEVKNADPSINPNATQEQIYAFQCLNTIAETYGMTIDDLCVVLVEYGLLQDSTGLVTNKAARGVEAATKALAAQKNELKEVEGIISKIEAGNIDELTQEDFTKLIEVFPESAIYIEEYTKAMAAATDKNDELAAQAKLFSRLGAAARALKAEKVASGLKDIADAANKFGRNSYQVQAAVLALGQYSPGLVDALSDEETGLIDVGVAAEYTAEALLALCNIRLTGLITNATSEINRIGAAIQSSLPSIAQDIAEGSSDRAALFKEYGEYYNSIAEYENAQKMLEAASKINIDVGGGGSTPADKIKESFDALNSSIEHSIFLQGQYYEEAEKSLDSTGMREALLKQIEYYKQIQAEAHRAAEKLRAYFRSQGLSAEQIEMQSEVQEMSKTWWDAADAIEEACQSIHEDIVKAFSDSVDEIQSVYKTLHDAADEYAKSGYITVDSLQSIIDMGVEYLALLQDENGQLVINEESINRIIKARTEQMAIESALAYVEALRIAKNENNIAELNRLLYATNEATGATWGLVYASLGLLGLEGDQYNAALRNINSLRALANSAVQSVGQVAADTMNTLKDMQSGVDDILKYVMDMIQHGIEEQIEALEELKEDYADLIELKKESLQATKDEADYEEEVAEAVKEIARLQDRIDLLTLDGSRDALAEKAKLQEELAEKQKDLADKQAEHALDTQINSLDKMQEAYEEQKDEEIKALENTISSQQKLYDMAIAHIQSNWDTLYTELIAWNSEYGSVLNSEISSAWDNALAAAQRYGNYVSALNQLPSDIEAAGASGNNTNLGSSFNDYDASHTNEDTIRAIVGIMESNAQAWHNVSGSKRDDLARDNEELAEQLRNMGLSVHKSNGVWYLGDGRRLFDVYHTGGIVGGGSIKENEVLAKLERGEVMISNQNKNTLFSLISFMEKLGKSLGTASIQSAVQPLIKSAQPDLSGVTNNRSDSISFGDVYIYGANDETVEKHREINRRFTNEILKHLNIKK